jgi:hypothetical protein
MAERMTNVDMLLMMTEDLKSRGDDLYDEMSERGTAHARNIVMMMEKVDKARVILLAEYERYKKYLPQPTAGQQAIGQNLEDQRRALEGVDQLPRVVRQGPREGRP